MQNDHTDQYYIIVNEQATGPYTYDEIVNHPSFSPETLVWKAGLSTWVPANTVPELAAVFAGVNPDNNNRPPEYNIPNQGYDNNNQGYNQGYDPNNQGYNSGNQGYGNNGNGYNPTGQGYGSKGPAYQQGQGNNPFANNPQYRHDHTYNRNHNYYNPNYNPYNQGYRPPMRTNWLPWAIVATVVGFFCSCIGAIFGIIAIVQANKANGFYAGGFDAEGDAANSNAKTMTIIGLVFAGIGIIIALFFGGILNTVGNPYI